ncbi:MAG: RNA methyltransferase [bacterium]|nr:RNA methyltransferase [bacterium]
MIISKSNAQVKYIKRLMQSVAFRYEEGVFVLESPKLILELQTQCPEMLDLVWRRGEEVSDEVFDGLSETKTSQGVLAVVKLPQWDEQTVLSNAKRVVVLDGIQDPANVGAILRSSAAFGADVVVLRFGTADPFSPKALRAGAGASWRLPIVHETDAVLHALSESILFFALDAQARLGVNRVPTDQWGLILGAEGQGVSADTVKQYAAKSISIATTDKVESLNVAVAAGVVLSQLFQAKS